VTGWCVVALRAARQSGLDVSESEFLHARALLEKMDLDWRLRAALSDPTVCRDDDLYASLTPVTAAIDLLSGLVLLSGKNERPHGCWDGTAKLVASHLPGAAGEPVNSYYWYWGTRALLRYDGPDGPLYTKWNKAQVDVLCQSQCTKKDGCASGSWPTEKDRWASWGGRVYVTALNVLSLETSGSARER